MLAGYIRVNHLSTWFNSISSSSSLFSWYQMGTGSKELCPNTTRFGIFKTLTAYSMADCVAPFVPS